MHAPKITPASSIDFLKFSLVAVAFLACSAFVTQYDNNLNSRSSRP